MSLTIEVMLAKRDRQNLPYQALITDVDDTFISHEDNPEARAAAWQLRNWAIETATPIILVTGAEFEALRHRIDQQTIPAAEAVVAAVGTYIWWQRPDGSYQKDEAYDQKMRATGYDRLAIAQKAKAHFAQAMAETGAVSITFQNPTAEAAYLRDPNPHYWPYKLSLYYFSNEKSAGKVATFYAKLFPKLNIIFCEEINHNATLPPNTAEKKYCLDILPATKADAAAYILKRFTITQGWKAGDSGNDQELLLHNDPLLPIVVGGYKPELYAAITAQLTGTLQHGPLQTLKDGRRLYLENNPTRIAASSIVNAVRLTG